MAFSQPWNPQNQAFLIAHWHLDLSLELQADTENLCYTKPASRVICSKSEPSTDVEKTLSSMITVIGQSVAHEKYHNYKPSVVLPELI